MQLGGKGFFRTIFFNLNFQLSHNPFQNCQKFYIHDYFFLAIAKIEKKFDIEFCYKWIDHIGTTVKQVR